ncbi:hypothetical protein EFA69_11080 [Rufibacter immobilis]|uniref:Uncharacterized protein n=1 Tax=Rufibacter immobilis TaxID=1348778 RepID=A0A3M9MWW9_9BACT|nr:hypothetical protein [Rufibacter immobilis]RNI30052.1 hypothetical protein EFA69_11080 [Rufibacter immobilis]
MQMHSLLGKGSVTERNQSSLFAWLFPKRLFLTRTSAYKLYLPEDQETNHLLLLGQLFSLLRHIYGHIRYIALRLGAIFLKIAPKRNALFYRHGKRNSNCFEFLFPVSPKNKKGAKNR